MRCWTGNARRSWRLLELVHTSESTGWRVLVATGIMLPAAPTREPLVKSPWPVWAEMMPFWIDDFTHLRASRRCALAVLDVVSRRWLATCVSP